MSHTEQIEWHRPSEQMPDADTTVLIVPGECCDTWVGFFDIVWRFADGMPCEDVTWWAHMPAGPREWRSS